MTCRSAGRSGHTLCTKSTESITRYSCSTTRTGTKPTKPSKSNKPSKSTEPTKSSKSTKPNKSSKSTKITKSATTTWHNATARSSPSTSIKLITYIPNREKTCLTKDQTKQIYKGIEKNKPINIQIVNQGVRDESMVRKKNK